MELPKIITLSWVQDLCSPPRPGRRFSRLGYLVIVAPDKFNAAQAELADGAIDLVFTAKRVHTPSLSRDLYYALASFEKVVLPQYRTKLDGRRSHAFTAAMSAKCQKRTLLHSITASARSSSDVGIVIPSAFAVLLLMTSSNRVACRSGSSLGRAPPRIFATCSAAVV